MITDDIVQHAEYIVSILGVIRMVKMCGDTPIGIRLLSK